jgi:hypothetical protein
MRCRQSASGGTLRMRPRPCRQPRPKPRSRSPGSIRQVFRAAKIQPVSAAGPKSYLTRCMVPLSGSIQRSIMVPTPQNQRRTWWHQKAAPKPMSSRRLERSVGGRQRSRTNVSKERSAFGAVRRARKFSTRPNTPPPSKLRTCHRSSGITELEAQLQDEPPSAQPGAPACDPSLLLNILAPDRLR